MSEGKNITNPSDLLKLAQAMSNFVKEIARTEKPFIDLRRKLINDIKDEKDTAKVDAVWLKHAKELSVTAAARCRSKGKVIPAIGYNTKGRSWPIDLSNPKDRGFNTYIRSSDEGDGTFEVPTIKTAIEFAKVIRGILDICLEMDNISHSHYVPYWDCLAVEYDDLEYGDEIFSYLCSSQGDYEVSDLAGGLSYNLGHIACGLYIVMFDKHMPVPANEGLVSDAVDFLFRKKKKQESYSKEDAENTAKQRKALELKIREFYENPEAFKLTGKSFTTGNHLHLSIDGKSPVVHSLPHAINKTFKSALEFSKKFKKDMAAHARIAKPLIDKFEKDMMAVMDRDGSVPQEALDKAMLPIIAARANLERTYFNSFGKDQHLVNDWVGGNPYLMTEYKRADGTTGWVDNGYNVDNPCVAVDKADKLETLTALLKEVLPFTDDGGLWLTLDGPFDFDAGDIKTVNYEFDRPIRHLSDMMSNEQLVAIFTLYSFEENTQSLYFKLCSHIDKVHDSVLSYVGGSIEKI